MIQQTRMIFSQQQIKLVFSYYSECQLIVYGFFYKLIFFNNKILV